MNDSDTSHQIQAIEAALKLDDPSLARTFQRLERQDALCAIAVFTLLAGAVRERVRYSRSFASEIAGSLSPPPTFLVSALRERLTGERDRGREIGGHAGVVVGWTDDAEV
jgi:hypothetical protein